MQWCCTPSGHWLLCRYFYRTVFKLSLCSHASYTVIVLDEKFLIYPTLIILTLFYTVLTQFSLQELLDSGALSALTTPELTGLSACLSVCLFDCLSVCLPVCLSACLLVCLSVCLSRTSICRLSLCLSVSNARVSVCLHRLLVYLPPAQFSLPPTPFPPLPASSPQVWCAQCGNLCRGVRSSWLTFTVKRGGSKTIHNNIENSQ